ncbi:hypothetical protein OBBRIDRAFT_259953 [Obba rivulosa]|uniref:Copper homeostasis protein cutC homolog n=1 Tax=Obba rivulosa TaxID=1052685 RepID=A0A8E2DGL7_9APHY|nr:hypothetical protein OBBRIDRAFT_259953 [Obba rivulosa]
MAMVRPRTGDFLYSDTEFNVMLEDVRFFKASGTAGVALGVLDQSGRVDVDRTRKLVDEAFPMQVCFHRAFDMTRDPLEALRDISTIPRVTRILTSGHGPIAPSSLHVLRTLFGTASATVPHAPAVLPGSGISPATARQLLDALLPCGLKEIHLSAGAWEPGAMVYRRHGMGMGAGGEGEWGVWRASEERVRAVRTIADEALREYYATVEKTVAGMADS